MIGDVLSRIRIFSIPDPRVQKAMDPESRNLVRNTAFYHRFTLNLCFDLKLISTLLEIRGRLSLTSSCSFSSLPTPPARLQWFTSPDASCKSITGSLFQLPFIWWTWDTPTPPPVVTSLLRLKHAWSAESRIYLPRLFWGGEGINLSPAYVGPPPPHPRWLFLFRRFIRQILQSLPPILDMMGLLLFNTVIYSVIGETVSVFKRVKELVVLL